MSNLEPFLYAHQNRDRMIWMSQNTNTLPTAPAIQEAINEAVQRREYSLYPHKNGLFGLPEAIREDLGAPDYDVLMTNGGIEALYIITRALLKRGHEVIASDPSFLPIHHQVSLCKAKTVEMP
ncbi:MAG: aminotransferase class I/II-fold pyridoxal phosphate-dependent enzyme, partial [Thermoplasmata archaeon]